MTNKTTTTFSMSETDMRKLVRNALMVAGQEMGETGDHWPVIKQTIKDVMRDWEDLETERAVHAELKKHLYTQLEEMGEILRTSSPSVREEVTPRLTELREVYDALFTEPKEDILYLDTLDDLYLDEADKPLHLRRAEAIIQTLEEDNA